MLRQIAIGAGMVFATTVIHAVFMVGAMLAHRALESGERRNQTQLRPMLRVATIILIMFMATIVEVSAWSGIYLWIGALSGLEPAAYFSMVTYTTLGYGDVLLQPDWRLLASLQAANGIIMFGWTTAIIVFVVQSAYFPSNRSESQDD
jgi:hypothetical protein